VAGCEHLKLALYSRNGEAGDSSHPHEGVTLGGSPNPPMTPIDVSIPFVFAPTAMARRTDDDMLGEDDVSHLYWSVHKLKVLAQGKKH